MRHLIRTDDFTIEQINTVLEDATLFGDGHFDPILREKIIITLFFEN